MTKTKLVVRGALLLGAIAVAFAYAGCGSAPPRVEPPPPKVSVSKPELRQIVDYDDYNGWLQPVESVDVRSRVRGHIEKIDFTDGDIVRKDQPLFELDPRPFQAEVDRSKEQVKIYEAQHDAAAKEEKRFKELVTKGGASQSQVDSAEAETKSLEAQIEATKEEVKRKELDLEYAKITAPITGRIGRAMMTVGNFVNAGGSDPVLTTIVSVDPIYAYFDVDERALQRYVKSRRPTTGPVVLREVKMPFKFGLETEDGYPHEGLLDFANNQVNPETGTIQVRGAVKNADGVFVPGSRVQIRVPVSDQYAALLVPDAAILSDQDKKYVLTLDDKNVVHRRDIELGKLLDDGSRIVRSGGDAKTTLTPDDWVITQGIQMARINYPVEPIRPTGSPTPATPPTSQPGVALSQ